MLRGLSFGTKAILSACPLKGLSIYPSITLTQADAVCVRFERKQWKSQRLWSIARLFQDNRPDITTDMNLKFIHFQRNERLIFDALHSVQNAAAGLVTGTQRRDRITPILTAPLTASTTTRQLQASRPGLQCIHGLASIYLSEDCRLMTSDSFRCRLRSAEVDTCLVPRTQL